jgi:hypothetical protein
MAGGAASVITNDGDSMPRAHPAHPRQCLSGVAARGSVLAAREDEAMNETKIRMAER